MRCWDAASCEQLAVEGGHSGDVFGETSIIENGTAGGMQEVVIPYTSDDSEKTFTTDAIAGPALLSYQIPDFYGNQKRYVESKDNDLMLVSTASQFISKYKCEDAETVAEVLT